MTDLPNIVLIGGAGAGKSTVAKLLEQFGYFRRAFAGVPENPHRGSPRDLVVRTWGPEAINDRYKIIAIGNAARSVDPDVWLRSLSRVLEAPPASWGPAIVVDDARFANEYFGLLGRGFVGIRVTAPDEVRELRLRASGKWVDDYFDHEIEHYLDDITPDYTITNDGTTTDLYDDVVRILERERKHR